MKKLLALALAVLMVVSMAACGKKDDNKGGEPAGESANYGSALEILETIWNSYDEADKFPVTGGDMETQIEMMEQDENYEMPTAPANYNMEYAESLTYSLLIPAEDLENVDAAATMTHLMNSNNFSCGVFHLKAGADMDAFAANVKEAVKNNHWMCGQPETLIIAAFGSEYVLVAFGIDDAMDPFQDYMKTAYAEVKVLCEEPLI